jgi:hypothetical protein
MLGLLIVVASAVILAVAGPRYGADSRTGFQDSDRCLGC